MTARTSLGAGRPSYPTWIRSSRIVLYWLLAIGLAGLGGLAAFIWPPLLAISVAAIPFFYIAIVLSWTSRRLGPHGDDIQGKIHMLLIEAAGAEGRLLDIGCGSGQLLIRFAKTYAGGKDRQDTGLDYWGADWEYSRAQAERNAQIEQVTGLSFLRGSASSLPFADASFDRVVSSLTFHEVRDVSDRTACLLEALRVLAPGGRFAFIDLFDDPKFYKGRQSVVDAIARGGGKVETLNRLSDVLALRFPLNLARVLKHAVFVRGTKPVGTTL